MSERYAKTLISNTDVIYYKCFSTDPRSMYPQLFSILDHDHSKHEHYKTVDLGVIKIIGK